MRRPPLLLGWLLLVLPAALLIPAFRNVVLEGIWAAYLMLLSLPQWMLWALFLITALYIMKKSLFPPKRPVAKAPSQAQQVEGQSRVGEWATAIDLASRTAYFERNLRQRLRKLAAEVLAHQKGLSAEQVKQQLDDASDIAPDIQAYLQQGAVEGELPPASGGFYRRVDRQNRQTTSEADLEGLLQYLEAQLEGERANRD